MGFWLGNTAWISGKIGPANDFSATVVRIVGTLKVLADLARPVTLFRSSAMSMERVGEGHLWLVVDEHEDVVVGGEQALGRRGGFGRGGDAEAHRQQDGKGLENA